MQQCIQLTGTNRSRAYPFFTVSQSGMVKVTMNGMSVFDLYEVLRVHLMILDSSMVEHSAVNRVVVGSSPTRGALWPHGQAVKTSPFHGGNTGSIPVGVTLEGFSMRGSFSRI